MNGCSLLQHVYALRGGGLVEAPHVVVHLGETLLHVILRAALPNRPEAEAHGGVVQLRGQQVERSLGEKEQKTKWAAVLNL